jgi:hypothetical protein
MATKKQAKAKVTNKKEATAKFTEADVGRLVKVSKDAADKHKKSLKQGEHFEALDEAGLRKKLKRINSPVINSMGWNLNAPPGGTINISVGFFNPDPVAQNELFVYLFVGPGTAITDNALFLLNVDTRFARLTQPAPFGVNLAPGASSSVNFALRVPTNMEQGTYMCNTVLLKHRSFDPGTIFDRGTIVFRVT